MSLKAMLSYSLCFSILSVSLLSCLNTVVSLRRLALAFISMFFSSLALSLLYMVAFYPYYLSPLRHLPAATQKPLYQRMFTEPNAYHFERWINEFPNDSCIRYFGFLNTERLFLTTPAGVNHMLRLQAGVMEKQPTARTILRKGAGQRGLVVTDGNLHKRTRKIMDPAFRLGMIRDVYYPLFWRKAGEMMQVLQKEQEEQGCSTMEMNGIIGRTIFDIVGEASMNHNWKALQSPDLYFHRISGFREAFEPSEDTRNWIILSFVLPAWLLSRLPTRFNRITGKAIQTVRRVCRDALLQKINPLRTAHLDANEFTYSNPESPKDKGNPKSILDFAIRAGTLEQSSFRMDFEQLTDQALMLQSGGAHSAVMGFLSTIYFLAQNPSLQDKLREEIRATVPSPDASINTPANPEVLRNSMPYLNAVLNEVLRLHSAFSWTGRVPTASITIPGIDVKIPAGTALSISPWALHRSHTLWGADAKEFKPERWLPNDQGKTPSIPKEICSFIPFGAGPRRCIGETFARGEMRCIIVALFGRYDVRFANERSIPGITHQLTVSFRKAMEVEMNVVEGW